MVFAVFSPQKRGTLNGPNDERGPNAEKLWSWTRSSLFGMPQWWVYLLGEGKGEKKLPTSFGTIWHLMTLKKGFMMNSYTILGTLVLIYWFQWMFLWHKPWILTSTHSYLELMQICGWEMWWTLLSPGCEKITSIPSFFIPFCTILKMLFGALGAVDVGNNHAN